MRDIRLFATAVTSKGRGNKQSGVSDELTTFFFFFFFLKKISDAMYVCRRSEPAWRARSSDRPAVSFTLILLSLGHLYISFIYLASVMFQEVALGFLASGSLAS